jgi:uncharacterized protein YaiI (UPF0178 family)
MQLLIDADACPVTAIAADIARKNHIPVVLVCDRNHVQHIPDAEVVTVDPGADAADLALVNRCRAGDLVVTQDYGVAALVLGRGGCAIHPSGRWYTNDNIDALLMERCIAGKQRRSKSRHHLKGPAKRTPEDDRRFAQSLERLLVQCLAR